MTKSVSMVIVVFFLGVTLNAQNQDGPRTHRNVGPPRNERIPVPPGTHKIVNPPGIENVRQPVLPDLGGQLHPPAMTFPNDTRFMLVGDSFTNDGNYDWAGKVRDTPPFDMRYFSAAGRTVQTMNALFNSHLAMALSDGPVHAVVIAGGINDIAQNHTTEQIKSDILSIIEKSGNRPVILTTIPPFKGANQGFWTQQRQDIADEISIWVLGLAIANSNLEVFNIRAVLDRNGDQMIDHEYSSIDNFHPQNCPLGNQCGMQVIASAFIATFQEPFTAGENGN